MNKIIVEVSVGELLDKISILEIKQEKIKDTEKLKFVSDEHSILKEQLDKNTEEGVKRRDEQIKKRLERKEAEAIRAKQEQLFGAKLQAFELDKIKDSSNVELKRLIRKAKSPLEVQAYTTILLLDDFMNNKTVTELQPQMPNLIQKLREIAEVTLDEQEE